MKNIPTMYYVVNARFARCMEGRKDNRQKNIGICYGVFDSAHKAYGYIGQRNLGMIAQVVKQ